LASAQNIAGIPDPIWPLPLNNHLDDGGLFAAGKYVMYRQSNDLKNQRVASQGLVDFDGSITGTPGTFIGTGNEALNVKDASGPGSYQPGFTTELGWRFRDGSTLTGSWMFITYTHYNHAATLAPPQLNAGTPPVFANTFLYSPVFGFPSDFSGPPNKVALGDASATFGIWNAASVMVIDFQQKAQQWELTYRKPIYDTECFRCSGLIGPRFFWIWERFYWRASDIDSTGNTSLQDIAIYTNIVSNRMYGIHAGFSNEWYIGKGFATQLDIQGAVFMDSVKERAKYETGLKHFGAANKRSVHDWTTVPEFQVTPSVMWYPIEGVQINVGYDIFGFFNTVASPEPISFNYGALDPKWSRTFRLFDGFTAGIAFIF
jgi:hypothetical protein